MKSRPLKPGGVEAYIEGCPASVHGKLKQVRKAIRAAAPGAIETVSYFDMPGYAYEGYNYNGMFAWFSFKAPYVRLHVRPPALESFKKELKGYVKTKAVLSLPASEPIPSALVQKLVKASLKVMKATAKK